MVRLYQYGDGIVEPFVYTDTYNRLGFAFAVGNTGASTNPYANVSIEVEYNWDYGDNDLVVANDTPELVVSTGLTEYKYTASITNTDVDANISVDNAATYVTVGRQYLAKLTANTGYTIGTVSVTMGSYDITDIVHKNGVIYIPNVTDNVTITATARKNVW